MKDIPGYKTFTKIEPLNKGWSSDTKYYIEAAEGKRLLLRVADIGEYDRKRAEYDMLKCVAKLDIVVSRPIDFGVCNDGKSVYQLLDWIDGQDAERVLPELSETQQYVLGMKAGETLLKMHSIPAPDNVEDWGLIFGRKVKGRIDFYNSHQIQSENADIIVCYLQDNQHLLSGRPQTFNHGDFNITNMIVTPDGNIGIIDFNYFNSDHGDPWWEFDPASWGNEPNAYFTSGEFHGYFGGQPPSEFFTMLAYYSAYDALAALCDTSNSEQGEPEVGKRHLDNTLRWFDNMRSLIPIWYLKNFYIQYIDGVPLKLKAPFDLSFVSRFGKVFKVFDDQDSGNLNFGVQADDGMRYFVKFAGAQTVRQKGSAEEAIAYLKKTLAIYQDLAHPTLIRSIKAEEVAGCFAMVFEWVDAICACRMYPADHKRFQELTIETKHRIYSDILEFHAHVNAKGYVAIDFYDGSILYDLNKEKTSICDIDFYSKKPYKNPIGRMWGSSRFMSPEEFVLGAEIDEVSNVYTMGATAFRLFTDSGRSLEKWPLSPELYAVIKKATSNDRNKRQQTILHLIEEWEAAKRLTLKSRGVS